MGVGRYLDVNDEVSGGGDAGVVDSDVDVMACSRYSKLNVTRNPVTFTRWTGGK
jgi:hypothetical protein